jgi:hypothetical protein
MLRGCHALLAGICWVQNGLSARRGERSIPAAGGESEQQRGRRAIFIATLWAVGLWAIFYVARQCGPTQALRSRLENRPNSLRQRHSYLATSTRGGGTFQNRFSSGV